ncbi:MAG: cupredoxin domain-containing protein [Patescibacteria group bacterium]
MKKYLFLAAAVMLFGAGCTTTSTVNVQPTTPSTNVNTQPAATGATNPGSPSVGTNPAATAPNNVTVTIQNFAFAPASVIVAKGASIVFTNEDSIAHTVTSDNGQFDSGSIAQGQSYILKTSTLAAGTYSYHCSVHPMMKATFIVQ